MTEVHTAVMPAVHDTCKACSTCTCALPNNWTRGLPQVERYVLRLLGAVQRRRGAAVPRPYQPFARQDAAFRWADAHPLAAELRCASTSVLSLHVECNPWPLSCGASLPEVLLCMLLMCVPS